MLKRFAGRSEKTLRALCAAAIFAVAATPVRAEDRTISADYTLAADETVEGVLTIESGATVDLAGHKLTVKGLAGDGTITSGGYSLDTSVSVPEIVSSESIFWLDASASDTLTIDGNGLVTKWTSRVGTHSANVESHGCAVTTTAPSFNTTTYGIPTVDFGAPASKQDLEFDTTFKNIRTVFWVLKIAKDKRVFWLGHNTYSSSTAGNTHHFHRCEDSGYNGAYAASYSNIDKMWCGAEQVGNLQKEFPDDTHFIVVAAEMKGDSTANCITQSKQYADRNGGRQLSELVCFNRELTDSERTAVTQYLTAKWLTPSEIHVIASSGETVNNSTVALTGNVKLVVEGGGTFTASKVNQAYLGGTEVAAGTTLLLGTASHPLGNGNATQTVTVRENARFDFGSNRNTSTCAYNFILYGGAKVNSTVPNGRNNQRLFGTVTLEGDATFTLGGTANFGGISEATRSRLVLNGHTLSLEQGGDGQWGFVNTVDDGVVQFTSGSSGVWIGSVDFSSATFGTAGTGFLNIGSFGFTCGTFQWKSSTKKWTGNTGGSVPIPKVTRRYIAGSFSPPLQMANGSTLDLSEVSGTWDDKTGKAWSDLNGYQNQTATRGLVSFASGATINIDVGERQVAAGDRLVQFASEPSGITFVPPQSMVDANLTVVAKQIDGTWYLCAKSTNIPYARWHIDATTPANSGWKFYNSVTGVERSDWDEGITEDVEVRFSSYAEWTAIQAQNVTPYRYLMDGAVVLDGLSSIWDLNGISIASGTTLDLNGYSVTLPSLQGFTSVTDSSQDDPGELHVNTAGGDIANSEVPFTGNMKLVIEGGHTFTASKANQSYTGGTEVLAGTLTLGTATHPLGNGNATQTVTLGAGAKFTSGANYNSTTCAYNFIADEGASMTFGTTGDRSTRRFGSIELLGDASITMQGKSAFVGLSAANPSTFKLNGNTLSVTVNGGADSNAKHIKSLDAGTIRFVSVDSNGMQNQDGVTDFSSARVEFASGAYVHLGNSGMTVGDFMYAGTKWRTFGGGIKVAGIYEAAAFHPPIEMQDGSTLDLSGITGALSATGTAPSNTGHNNHVEAGAITFASDAVVGVDLSERTDLRELAKSATPYVVTWSSQPNATFTLDAKTAERFKLEPDATGIKLVRRRAFTVIIR